MAATTRTYNGYTLWGDVELDGAGVAVLHWQLIGPTGVVLRDGRNPASGTTAVITALKAAADAHASAIATLGTEIVK